MRLTADLVLRALARINPVQDREIDLRGFKIPVIENLGSTRDQFDAINLSDNEIKKVENFPRLIRLKVLLLCNNHISRISPEICEQISNLETLILTNNKITILSELDHLTGLKKLETLSLVENPVVRRQYYRLYVIYKLPQLKVLDYQKIKQKERDDATRLFSSTAGQQLQEDVDREAKISLPQERSLLSNGTGSSQLSEEEVARIKEAIENAKSPDEVDRLERQLKAGIIPKGPSQRQQNYEENFLIEQKMNGDEVDQSTGYMDGNQLYQLSNEGMKETNGNHEDQMVKQKNSNVSEEEEYDDDDNDGSDDDGSDNDIEDN